MIIDQTGLADVPVQNQVLPKGGPKSVSVALNFKAAGGNSSYDLNLQNMQALNRFSNLQTLYVDNSLNTQLLTITIGGTGQLIKVKAGMQGYYPVLSANPIALNCSVAAIAATDAAVIFLLNFPCAPGSWATT